MRKLIATTAAAALLLATAASAATVDPPLPAQAGRTVTVTGSGEAYGVPDRARLSMSVEITRPQLRDAEDEANRCVREFLAKARALGSREEDFSTAALSIRAEYNYLNNNGTQTRRFAGYHVSRGVELLVRDLDHVGDYLGAATEAGINNVSDPQLESSKADELRRQALANAAVDARAKAQILASTLGAKLGPVHTISAASDQDSPRPPRPMLAMARTADSEGGNEEMGFAGGQIRITATLLAEFDLLVP
jgi:uncharacterized protein YggE